LVWFGITSDVFDLKQGFIWFSFVLHM